MMLSSRLQVPYTPSPRQRVSPVAVSAPSITVSRRLGTRLMEPPRIDEPFPVLRQIMDVPHIAHGTWLLRNVSAAVHRTKSLGPWHRLRSLGQMRFVYNPGPLL
ncbi:hypothetical protein B0T18DRAFT_185173 [Schizothecium vesticola]|uniref:Uncharacterized protein n=1 Tax=Schizothecium vesticola TaxID=314040 RepID=A0AA40EQ56_9PEZI|nr:hypothetical protein B0T18DRAFT_185173 [Schizothecium vesticola]